MAKTPFVDLKSEDILSAHISGVQHSVNKIEEVLNMNTAVATDHALIPVADQADASLRYLIYEGTVRNWISTPAPVIKRNGTVVPSNEYTLYPAYGAIVFNVQQDQVYNITADFTHVTNTSGVIQGLNSTISTVSGDVSTLETRVTTLENGGSLDSIGVFDLSGAAVNSIFSNTRADVKPYNIGIGANAIGMAANQIDAIPIIIKEAATITQMRITLFSGSPTGNHIMGIYSNKPTLPNPNTLLAETAVFAHTTGATATHTKLLKTPVTLQPGVYWLARWHDNAAQVNGHVFDPAKHISINPPNTAQANISGVNTLALGVRTTTALTSLTTLPVSFPTVGSGGTDARYLVRDQVGTIYAVK